MKGKGGFKTVTRSLPTSSWEHKLANDEILE